jgi:hypothetical protein
MKMPSKSGYGLDLIITRLGTLATHTAHATIAAVAINAPATHIAASAIITA